MERVPKGVFTKEFKETAVKMVTEGGLSMPEVGRRLSIPKSTLAHWVKIQRKACFQIPARNRNMLPGNRWNLPASKLR